MTPGFTPLITEYVDGRNWILAAPLTMTDKDGTQYRAAAGFVTDFASIPRFLWDRGLPPTGNGPNARYGPAAVIHDAAYRNLLEDGAGLPLEVTKAKADQLFLRGMELLGVGKVRRTLMFWAVKWFGKGHWSQPVTDGVAR